MIVRYAELFLLVGISLFTDIKQYKIKNKVIFVFIVLGITVNLIIGGLNGGIASIIGLVIPFITLILFFALRMIGAGDIKLFCAIGAIMGTNYIINNMVYSFLCGGVLTLILMIRRGILIKRLKYAFYYFINIIFTKKVHPYTDFTTLTDKEKFKFAYAIAAGVIVQALIKYYYKSYFF